MRNAPSGRPNPFTQEPDTLARELIDTVRRINGRGWCDGTSGNYSVVVSRDPLRLLITPSGADKGRVDTGDLEDEVRFIVKGRGVFHIHPTDDPVFRIQVEAGDMINVPHGTRHWFDLCDEKRVLAVRVFQDPSGWTPHYTGTGEETHHEPVCFGPMFVPPVPPAS